MRGRQSAGPADATYIGVAIEEVEVELVDISQLPQQMSRLGWMPADRLAVLPGPTGTPPGSVRRKVPRSP